MNPLLAALVQAGLMEQADADRLSRQLDNNLAREYAEQQMLLAWQAALSSQRDRLVDAVRGADGLLSVAQQNRLWAGENARLWASVRETVLDVASERAVVATIEAGAIDDQWTLINEAVIQEAEGYYLSPDAENVGSVQSLNATSRQRFTDAFVQWQRGTLPATGIDGLPELINALESVFGARRAEAIGVTETTRLFSMSELASARANEFVEYLMWETGNDELVCPICGPRQSQVVAKTVDGFRVPTDNVVGFPPAHVRCRCAMTQLTGPALDALIADGLVAPVAGRGATAPRVPFVPTPVVEPRERVTVPRFANVGEAQRYARDVLGVSEVDYSTIPLEFAQEINDGLADVQAIYSGSAAKPQFIRFDATRNFVARQEIEGRGILINPLEMRSYNPDSNTVADLQKKVGRIERKIAAAAETPGLYTDEQLRFFRSQIDEFNVDIANRIETPAFYAKNFRDIIVHEMGHGVHFDLIYGEHEGITGFLDPQAARDRGLKFEDQLSTKLSIVSRREGRKISEYATANEEEYMAESFTAFVRGDTDKINPDILDVYRKITR